MVPKCHLQAAVTVIWPFRSLNSGYCDPLTLNVWSVACKAVVMSSFGCGHCCLASWIEDSDARCLSWEAEVPIPGTSILNQHQEPGPSWNISGQLLTYSRSPPPTTVEHVFLRKIQYVYRCGGLFSTRRQAHCHIHTERAFPHTAQHSTASCCVSCLPEVMVQAVSSLLSHHTVPPALVTTLFLSPSLFFHGPFSLPPSLGPDMSLPFMSLSASTGTWWEHLLKWTMGHICQGLLALLDTRHVIQE